MKLRDFAWPVVQPPRIWW